MTRTTPAGAFQRRRQCLPQRRHLRQQCFALVGQQHVVGVALKQPQRQLLFQRADVFADRRRRHAQLAGGGGEILRLRGGEEGRQQAMHVKG